MKRLLLVLCTTILSLVVAPILAQKSSEKSFEKSKVKVYTHHPEIYCQGKPPIVDKESAAVLGHFAGILSSFLNLLQAPRDTKNVGHYLSDMIHGLANIISTAVRRGKKLEEYVEGPEFREEIAKLIIKRVFMLEPDDYYEATENK